MTQYLVNACQYLGFKVEVDSVGNVYGVRGKAKSYPLLNAHMDIVRGYDSAKINSNLTKKGYYKSYDMKETKKDKSKEKRCKICTEYCDCIDIIKKEDPDKIKTFFEASEELLAMDCAKTCTSFNEKKLSYYGYDDDYYDNLYYGYGKSHSYYVSPTYTKEEIEAIDEDIQRKYTIHYDSNKFKIYSNEVRVLGGDDKCGIAIALQVARETKVPMKVLFTVSEEIGCVGVKHFVNSAYGKEFMSNVDYSITIDRRGGRDLLFQSCSKDNCTPAFAGWVTQMALETGFMPNITNGSVADVLHLRNFCDAVNISAGYYEPHTLKEYIQFDEMIDIKNWVRQMVNN